LSKTDLLPHIPFDIDLFRSDVQRLNPGVKLLEISVVKAGGLRDWIYWIELQLERRRPGKLRVAGEARVR
jgi:hydrogenase nickel incorporation protein HypB